MTCFDLNFDLNTGGDSVMSEALVYVFNENKSYILSKTGLLYSIHKYPNRYFPPCPCLLMHTDIHKLCLVV